MNNEFNPIKSIEYMIKFDEANYSMNMLKKNIVHSCKAIQVKIYLSNE